jgi:hypothetical protein
MEGKISDNVVPVEGSVTLPIAEYHKLLKLSTDKERALVESESEYNLKIEEKNKETIEETKKLVKMQEKTRKALKIISANIAQLNINGEKDVRRAGMLQEAILEGVDAVIQEFDEVSDEELKDRANIS